MKCRRVEIWVAAVLLFVSASPVMALIQFNDGGEWDIDYEINDDVWVDFESPGMGTTVNLLDGGAIGSPYDLQVLEDSQLNILGGLISARLHTWDRSQVTMSGGQIGYLYAWDRSQVSIFGGLFGGVLRVSSNAVLTIHGWDFAVDGTPVGYTELYSILGGGCESEPYRRLTGTLFSGDPLNNGFRIGNSGKIVLVPEPTTLLLLGLGAVMVRKRR